MTLNQGFVLCVQRHSQILLRKTPRGTTPHLPHSPLEHVANKPALPFHVVDRGLLARALIYLLVFDCVQSWIDIFGARMSKAGGSLVTDAFSSSIPGLIHVGGSVAASGAAFLIWVAWVMGKKFDDLMETGEIVGGDGEVR